jgi:hypothetical protein
MRMMLGFSEEYAQQEKRRTTKVRKADRGIMSKQG